MEVKVHDSTGFEPVIITERNYHSIATFVEGAYWPNLKQGVTRPSASRTRNYISAAVVPVAKVLPVLEAAGVAVDAEIREGLERALSLRSQRVTDQPPADRRALEAELAAGEIDAAEFEKRLAKVGSKPTTPVRERADILRRAASAAYLEAHARLAAIGDDLIEGPLAAMCDELLDDPTAVGAEGRWAAMWAAVDGLRKNYLASSVQGAPRVLELYELAHRANAWRLAEVQRKDASALQFVASGPRGKAGAIVWRKVRPDRRHLAPDPCTLGRASARREEWGAKLLSADEIDQNIERILAAERGLV